MAVKKKKQGRINRARGKRNQKATANLLGGRDIGTLGKEDVLLELFSVECKSLEELPKWFQKCWDQAATNTEKGKETLLQIHELGDRHLEDFIVIKLNVFKVFLEMVRKAAPKLS